MPKRYFTTDKTGEEVEVDSALASELVRSGKRKPEDFTIEDLPYNQPTVDEAPADKTIPTARPIDRAGPILGSLAFLGRQIDRVSLAPIRGAVEEFQRPGKPRFMGLERGAMKGLIDPESVPTTKETMTSFGLSDQPITNTPLFTRPGGPHIPFPSPAGAAGFAADLLAPIPPVMGPLKALTKGTAKTAAKTAYVPIKGGAVVASETAGLPAPLDFLTAVERGVGKTVARKKANMNAVMNPKMAEDAAEVMATARKAGIDPSDISQIESLKYGDLSVPARRQKMIRQGPEGQLELERYDRVQDKIQAAYNREIHKIGGPPLSPPDAGVVIKQGVEDGLKRLSDEVTMTHSGIIETFPGLKVTAKEAQGIDSKLAGLEKFAKGRSQRGIDPAQRSSAERILNAVEAVRNSNYSYKQLNEAREMIGEVAFEKVGTLEKIPSYEKKLRELYFDINDALIGTVRKQDLIRSGQFRKTGESFETMADKLEESNKIMSEAMDDKSVLSQVLGTKRKDAEKVFSSVFSGTGKIKALKRFLTPEQIQQLKSTYLENLTKRNVDGEFTYKSTFNKLRDKESILSELFDDPNELNELMGVLKLGRRVGDPFVPGSAGQMDFKFNLMDKVQENIATPISESLVEYGKLRAARPKTPVKGLPYKNMFFKPLRAISNQYYEPEYTVE